MKLFSLGQRYNIPVCILLPYNYPNVAPLVFIKPTTSMSIQEGKDVSATGRVSLSYLIKQKRVSVFIDQLVLWPTQDLPRILPTSMKSSRMGTSWVSLSCNAELFQKLLEMYMHLSKVIYTWCTVLQSGYCSCLR